jgi:UDP-4-amino-4-deoxy-L-arabinose-oxoglutarate aminotransferase
LFLVTIARDFAANQTHSRNRPVTSATSIHASAATGIPFLPFSRPSIDADDIAAVTEVLQSGWITTGKKCAEFETRFAEYTGSKYAVAMTSATAGLHLLLHALDIGPGDEIITPSMTWVSTVNLIVLRGATPVFVDVDADTLMTDAAAIEPLITKRTKLIIPVHYAGAALDLDPLRALADQHGVMLVEDCAHAAGTRYKGQSIGNRGTAIFSFHPIKNLTTGEGGMVCTDDEELASTIRRLRFHGLGMDSYQRETQGRSPQAEVLEPGFKYNLPDMNAALGLSQLNRLDTMNAKRASIAARYAELLADVAGVVPLAIPDLPMNHAWHLYIARIDEARTGINRDQFMAAMQERGIGTGLHFKAVHRHRFYRSLSNVPPLPNTEWNSDRVCSLPLFPDMQLDDVARVVTTIRSIIGQSKS